MMKNPSPSKKTCSASSAVGYVLTATAARRVRLGAARTFREAETGDRVCSTVSGVVAQCCRPIEQPIGRAKDRIVFLLHVLRRLQVWTQARPGHGVRLSNIQIDAVVVVFNFCSYVDEHGKELGHQASREFMELLEAIQQSRFYTSDPSKACLFISSLDTLNQEGLNLNAISQILNSLPYWDNGTNHLLFNMLPGMLPSYATSLEVNTGQAMVAGGGFDSWTFRRSHDISIPVFNPARYELDPSLARRSDRPWLLISAQPGIHFEFRTVVASLAKAHHDVLNLAGCSRAWDSRLRCRGSRHYKYPDILTEGKFCLVVRAARLGQMALSDALSAGMHSCGGSRTSMCCPSRRCSTGKVSFTSYRAAVRIREDELEDVIGILKGFSEARVSEMRSQVLLIWERYFRSMERIAMTTLEIINDRLFPHVGKSYEDWNDLPPGLVLPAPFAIPFVAPRSRGFTAVVLTLRPAEQPVQGRPAVGPASSWPKLSKPLKVIRTKANKLSNRFYPYKDIETEAVLAIDDDILMLTSDELEFGFEVWREFPDRIVGFPSRVHLWDNTTSLWKYESEWTNDISMVLTGAAFYHKHYSHEYFDRLPANIRHWVDDRMNCEDIAMNFLVANITGKAPIKVAPRKKFKCPECARLDNLSNDLQHMAARSECVNVFARAFGGMPLKTVEFRADPVLFKDNFPEKLKRFSNLGSL
ncbi:hypothetical protein HPB51_019795 [Rhipicephalus microplus]|uniref:Exostosin-2 n=1 Tax=Rhipicephalus microplus TaxID=6941 RepID=A0A9J6EBI3_RHIMP|nr:hypothetical protein HPB51_019795 [Rhipicephalus microplus]